MSEGRLGCCCNRAPCGPINVSGWAPHAGWPSNSVHWWGSYSGRPDGGDPNDPYALLGWGLTPLSAPTQPPGGMPWSTPPPIHWPLTGGTYYPEDCGARQDKWLKLNGTIYGLAGYDSTNGSPVPVTLTVEAEYEPLSGQLVHVLHELDGVRMYEWEVDQSTGQTSEFVGTYSNAQIGLPPTPYGEFTVDFGAGSPDRAILSTTIGKNTATQSVSFGPHILFTSTVSITLSTPNTLAMVEERALSLAHLFNLDDCPVNRGSYTINKVAGKQLEYGVHLVVGWAFWPLRIEVASPSPPYRDDFIAQQPQTYRWNDGGLLGAVGTDYDADKYALFGRTYMTDNYVQVFRTHFGTERSETCLRAYEGQPCWYDIPDGTQLQLERASWIWPLQPGTENTCVAPHFVCEKPFHDGPAPQCVTLEPADFAAFFEWGVGEVELGCGAHRGSLCCYKVAVPGAEFSTPYPYPNHACSSPP